VFVAALAASGYMYVEATGSQELAARLSAHVNALEFYGAAPRLVVPDNLKSGVTKACWYDPELNDRSQLRTVVVTQLPVEDWHAALTAGDPTPRRCHPGSTGTQRPPTHTSGQLDAPTPATTTI
jgi:hypothetical protein